MPRWAVPVRTASERWFRLLRLVYGRLDDDDGGGAGRALWTNGARYRTGLTVNSVVSVVAIRTIDSIQAGRPLAVDGGAITVPVNVLMCITGS
jgi:hypothetical protein